MTTEQKTGGGQVEHTPGPWFKRAEPTLDGLCVIEDRRQDGLFPITCEWKEADLVAAAPDLKLELQAAFETLDALCLAGNMDLVAAALPDGHGMDSFRAALAKARGGTS